MDEIASGADEDFKRELNARRKDLEREFDEKQRDLKAQHKRQADKLQRDRLDWESYKKEQAKALADQAERLHRKADNTQKAEVSRDAAADEARELKARVQELEAEKLKAKVARERLDGRLARLERRASSAGGYATALAIVAVIGFAAWLLEAAQDGRGLVEPGVALALAAALGGLWLRARMR